MNEVKFKANKKDLEALSGQIQEATAALDTSEATAGQVLKVETPGEAPVWGSAGGGGVELEYSVRQSITIPAGESVASSRLSRTLKNSVTQDASIFVKNAVMIPSACSNTAGAIVIGSVRRESSNSIYCEMTAIRTSSDTTSSVSVQGDIAFCVLKNLIRS